MKIENENLIEEFTELKRNKKKKTQNEERKKQYPTGVKTQNIIIR